ncbi:MAG: ABC transporter substrate-binding protein [Acetobacteraceae bacterium]
MTEFVNITRPAIGRRGFLVSAGLAGAALGLGVRGAGAAEAEPRVLRIGTFQETNPTAVLQGSGILEKMTSSKVRWMNVGSGGAFNTLAAAGGIDVGLGHGTSPLAAALAVGIGLKAVAMCDNIAGAEEMTVRTSKHITTPKDFIGKTVAVPFGSTSNFRLAGFLDRNHLLGKVKLVYMSPPEMVAAWKRGEIDAGYVWPPAKGTLLADGGEVYETYKELDAAGYVIGDLISVRDVILQKYPATVVTLLRAYGKAYEISEQDPGKASAMIGKELDLKPADALADMKEYQFISLKESMSPDWLGPPGKPGRLAEVLHRNAEFLYGQKSIPRVPAVSVFAAGIDTEPLTKALA